MQLFLTDQTLPAIFSDEANAGRISGIKAREFF